MRNGLQRSMALLIAPLALDALEGEVQRFEC